MVIGITGVIVAAIIAITDPLKRQQQARNRNAEFVAEEFAQATKTYAISNNNLPCVLPSSSPGKSLSILNSCIDTLVASNNLKSFFRSSSYLTSISTYYDSQNKMLYTCVSSQLCTSLRVSSVLLPSPTQIISTPSP